MFLSFLLQNKHPEDSHQIVGDHGKRQRSFCGVESVEIKTIKTKVIFEFFNAVFRITAASVKPPDFRRRELQIREIGNIAVMVIYLLVGKQAQRFTGTIICEGVEVVKNISDQGKDFSFKVRKPFFSRNKVLTIESESIGIAEIRCKKIIPQEYEILLFSKIQNQWVPRNSMSFN